MDFSLAKDLNAVAIYAAVVSTLVFMWQVYVHFREGPRLRVRANPNMRFVQDGGLSKESYIMINVSNRGSSDTTITHVVAFAYDGWLKRLRSKPSVTMIINHDSASYPIPYVLEVGRMFSSMARQTPDIEELSRTKHLYVGIYHSFSERPSLYRVTIKPEKEGAETPPDKTMIK